MGAPLLIGAQGIHLQRDLYSYLKSASGVRSLTYVLLFRRVARAVQKRRL